MNEENVKVKKPKAKFEIDKTGFFAEAAMLLLFQSVIFRLIGSWGKWDNDFFVMTQIALPVVSALLLIACIALLGKKFFAVSFIPVLMGVAFFIIKSLGFDTMLHTVLCIALYALVAVIYTLTVFGVIRTKLLFIPLFGLPFLYHIFVEDLAAMRDTVNPVTFTDGMMEMSVLCVMAALFCIGIALKKRKPTAPEVELPKIKDPVVISPKKPELNTEPEIAEGANAEAAADESENSAE